MITETYKLMCINNPDLQGLWKPKDGDRFIDTCVSWKVRYKKGGNMGIKPLYRWLPYQEDLQELLGAIRRYWEAVKMLSQSNDLSEMWMEYFMSYKFNKKWDFDKKEWVKI